MTAMRKVMSASVAVLALVAVAGCPGEEGPTKACNTWVTEGPVGYLDPETGLNGVRAITVSECDHPVFSHAVVATFEYEDGGRWPAMGNGGICADKPQPGLQSKCTHELPGVCVEGNWRVRLLITGEGPRADGTVDTFAITLPEEAYDTVKCPRPRPE